MTKIVAAAVPLLPLALAPSLPGDSNAVVMWILGLAGVAVIFNQVATAWRTLTTGLKESPPPFTTYATKSDCVNKHQSVAQQFEKFEEREAQRDKLQEARTAALHNRINEVLAAVSRVEGKVGM